MNLDCDAGSGPRLLTLEEVRDRINGSVEPLGARERVPLEEVLGRILADDLLSPINIPPFANSAMDGYAVRSSDTSSTEGVSLTVTGTAWAGHPFTGNVEPGQCVRIFTGAALPQGADAVVMQESVQAGTDCIVVPGHVERGEWVRAEGRDLAMGTMALPRGKRLSAIDIGLIASLGIPEITVSRQVRIGLLATGDELTPVGTPLRPGFIYDSNRLAIRGLLSSPALQVTDLGCCRDDAAALRAALLEASSWNDALVTIGGASVGDADHVVPVLREIGHVALWKMAVKPGKPFLYGRIGGCHVFGLPGNPASAMVTCLQVVRPAVARLAGALPEPALRVRAICEQPIVKTTDRLEFQRGVFRAESDGKLVVRAVEGQDADRVASFSAANCFLVLPADCRGLAAGEPVTIEPFGSSL